MACYLLYNNNTNNNMPYSYSQHQSTSGVSLSCCYSDWWGSSGFYRDLLPVNNLSRRGSQTHARSQSLDRTTDGHNRKINYLSHWHTHTQKGAWTCWGCMAVPAQQVVCVRAWVISSNSISRDRKTNRRRTQCYCYRWVKWALNILFPVILSRFPDTLRLNH